MLVELRPGHHLDDLLERADAAGERDEGVGALEHDALPLMHVGGDDQLRHLLQHHLAVLEELRDDAGHLAAMGHDGAGDDAHQPDRAAAIDEADAGLGHVAAEPFGGARHIPASLPSFDPQ